MQMKMPSREAKIDIGRALIGGTAAAVVSALARYHGHAAGGDRDRATPLASVTASLCGAAAGAVFTLFMHPESDAGD
jgi:hypothetical protein